MTLRRAAWAAVAVVCLGTAPARACQLAAWPPTYRTVAPRLEPDALRWLALTSWAEARGDGFCAMVAVSHTILNRLRSGAFGSTVRQITRAPFQFSVWNEGGAKLGKLSERDPVYVLAQLAAAAAASGAVPDNTGGALYFHAASMRPRPTWAGRLTRTVQVGGHIFYRGKRVDE
jgi:spore germination cell wall hydrolase CwlJ-like protein